MNQTVWRAAALAGCCAASLWAAETGAPEKPACLPRVTAVEPASAGLHDHIIVRVSCWETAQETQTHGRLLPFLGDQILLGSRFLWLDRTEGKPVGLVFRLARDASNGDSRSAWGRVLGGFGDGWMNGPRTLAVSAGTAELGPLPSDARLRVRVFRQPWTSIALGAMVLIASVFVYLHRRGLLRGPSPDGSPGAYSLSAFQIACWFGVIMGVYVFVWLLNGDAAFSDSALGLLGISGATALAGRVAGGGKAPLRASGSFLKDILSDDSGISFHRFQMLAWTVVLALVFVREAITNVAMPELPGSLLALMGISSGTYLGFKIPEKRDAPTAGGGGAQE